MSNPIEFINPAWERTGYGTEPGKVTAYGQNQTLSPIPAIEAKAQELAPHGFTLYRKPVNVVLQETQVGKEPVTKYYTADHRAHFINKENDVALSVKVKGGAPTLELLVVGITAETGISLTSMREPVPGGKGQFKRCREIAEDIYRRYGHLMPEQGFSAIFVRYLTRKGKGGRHGAQTANRSYFRDDFKDTPAPVPTEAQAGGGGNG